MTRTEKIERVAAAILDAESEKDRSVHGLATLEWEDLSVSTRKRYIAMAEAAVKEWEK